MARGGGDGLLEAEIKRFNCKFVPFLAADREKEKAMTSVPLPLGQAYLSSSITRNPVALSRSCAVVASSGT